MQYSQNIQHVASGYRTYFTAKKVTQEVGTQRIHRVNLAFYPQKQVA